jgi:hypothetical protein
VRFCPDIASTRYLLILFLVLLLAHEHVTRALHRVLDLLLLDLLLTLQQLQPIQQQIDVLLALVPDLTSVENCVSASLHG